MENFTIVNKCITLVAKRNSGKSILLRYLVRQYKTDFKKIFCICPTESINKFYQTDEFVDPKNIYDSYDESWVEALIKKMTSINEGKTDEEKKYILLILDDLVADTKFHQSKSLKKLFVRGRHIGISIMITSQFMTGIPPVARTNSDYVCIGQLNKAGLDLVAEEYTTAGLTKDQFVQMYHEKTRDYNFLIINNNSSKTGDINESYGSLKAPESEF